MLHYILFPSFVLSEENDLYNSKINNYFLVQNMPKIVGSWGSYSAPQFPYWILAEIVKG